MAIMAMGGDAFCRVEESCDEVCLRGACDSSVSFRRLRNMGWASIGGVGYTENEGGRKTGGDMNGQKKHMLLGSAPATITGRSGANRIRGQLNIGFVVTGMFRIGDARDGGEE